MSKIIDKTVHIQTQEYLDENDLLCKYQSGFRTNFSTDFCLVLYSEKNGQRMSHWDDLSCTYTKNGMY